MVELQRVVDYIKQYIGVITIVLAACILLTYTLSYFAITSGNHRAAEMYIGELKYSISVDELKTNTVSVPSGETIIDIGITNLNEIDTYYKLLYLKNSNIKIAYYKETKNTSNVATKYKSPSDSIIKSDKGTIKLKIVNNTTENQTITFSLSGGYITNKLNDVEVPNIYSEITDIETASTNTYFCKTANSLSKELEYIDGAYTYKYQMEGTDSGWKEITKNGWGVVLTNKNSTNDVIDNVCTYINNKPIVSMSYMYLNSASTSINLNMNTSNVTNMHSMFSNSKAISLDLINFDTSNVTDMGHMFNECTSLTSLNVSSFDTSKVINFSQMFQNCSKITSLDLTNFNTSNVTNMGGMFYNCRSLSNLNVNSFNTSNTTLMNNMFSGCSSLKSLDVSNFNTNKVVNMYGMFLGLSSLESIDLSNFNTSNVIDMGHTFDGDNKLTILDITNFDTKNVTRMHSMFANCNSLKELNLKNFDTSKVTRMDNMFVNCSSLETLTFGNNFNTSKVVDMNHMFSGCKNLPSINISAFNTSSVTNMSYMFYENMKITNLDISGFNTSKVTNTDFMFASCNNLNTIYASTLWNSSNITSSDSMFKSNSKLIGGVGTKYDANYTDKTYARIDTASTPGYFTLKNN